jgi:phenylalanine ammonia-lyase
MNIRYLAKLHDLLSTELPRILTTANAEAFITAESKLFATLKVRFGETTTLESEERFQVMLAPLVYELYSMVSSSTHLELQSSLNPLDWTKSLTAEAKALFLKNRLEYLTCDGSAYESLGLAGKVVYGFVRKDLGVLMRKGFPGMDRHEIGSGISEIFDAIHSGKMDTVWKDAVAGDIDN